MPSYIDQINFRIELEQIPQKIISLVPSQTELLATLGLQSSLAGITKYCIYPPEVFLSVPHVGGTKSIDIELIKKINPDLIIANKEENPKDHIEELRSRFPVWTSDVSNLYEALDMIHCIGSITNTHDAARELINKINASFKNLEHTTKTLSHFPKTIYLLWRKPYMGAGGDTFIHDMLDRCGFDNALYYEKRYPELTKQQIKEINPEIIFLSSEPFPFKEKHINELKKICPNARIFLVDGEYFSWYGSRLTQTVDYMKKLTDEVFTAFRK
jgi:ABC-type Fe3+-hydroxamate transport system substrate-binding protein